MTKYSNIQIWWEYSFKQGELIQDMEFDKDKINKDQIWNNIESQVIHLNIEGIKYKESLNSIFSQSNNDILKEIKLLLSDNNLKFNILLKIAFKMGILNSYIKKNKADSDTIKLVNDNKLILLDTYVSTEDQKTIDKKYLDNTQLDQLKDYIHMLGGGDRYYQKYLKYKYKYLLKKYKKLI